MPDRELGGYANANALAGGGVSLREIAVIISPAAGTTLQQVEQTFTVPGVLASDRLAYLTQTTGSYATMATSGIVFPLAGRVSAISIVSIPFETPGTAATPTASTTWVFGIAAARLIPQMPDRELGGYVNANAVPGSGVSVREIAIILSPAAGTALQQVEQTFTVPGVLASDRCAYLTQTTGSYSAMTTSGVIFPLAGRVSAISIVSVPFFCAATTAAQPTASTTWVFGIASARLIP